MTALLRINKVNINEDKCVDTVSTAIECSSFPQFGIGCSDGSIVSDARVAFNGRLCMKTCLKVYQNPLVCPSVCIL